MAVIIKKLTNRDVDCFLDLLNVFKNVFEWVSRTPDPLYLKKVLDNKQFLVFIAIIDNVVVGGLTAYILDRYDSEKPSAYIYDIAVIRERQRNGIGKDLIATLNDYCKENNFSEAFVQAEMEDTQAIGFYRGTPVSSELQALHFTYSFDN